MKSLCSVYLVTRVLVGFLDTVTDILLCVNLVLESHYIWASLVGSWVLLGYLASLLAVLIERCRRGVSLSCYKYFLLTLKTHVEYGEAFFQSGPQLVTQLFFFFNGLHVHDFKTYTSDDLSISQGWAWLQVISVIVSLVSLILTGCWFNSEPGPGCRIFSSIMCTITITIYRVFIFSVIIVISPLIAAAVIATIYIVTIVQQACCGNGLKSIPHSYYSLYLPVGHNKYEDKTLDTIVPRKTKIDHLSVSLKMCHQVP